MSQPSKQFPEIKQLSFEHMTFRYDNSAPVFEDVSFDLPTDQYVWIRSLHTGAGRSTLLQIMAGLAPITAGKYSINDKNVGDMSFEEFLPYRLSIGYSFDFGGLLHNQSLYDNMMLPLLYHKLCTPVEAERKVKMYMQELGILRYKDQRPSAVQGSVRKIACLLRPLLMSPQLLLLDDPSLGLGQEVVLKYFDLIQDLRRDGLAKHVYISTFDEKLMGLLEHQEVFIDNGQLHATSDGYEKKVVSL